MDEAWVAHGIQRWFDLTRRSANAKDKMRNPHNRKDKDLYDMHYLDVRIKKIHDDIVATGKQKFGEDFHWSWWYTLKVRPFQVKAAGREVSSYYIEFLYDQH